MSNQPPPSDWVQLSELPEIDLPDLDKERAGEDDFLTDLVHAANSVRKYLMLVACVWASTPIDRFVRAVLMGHMVRIYKLYDTLVFLTVERRTEVTWIVARALTDAIINMRYLLRYPSKTQLYIRQSLAYEKKNMEEIQRRMHDPPLPIETRMLESIEAVFSRAGIKPADIKAREWKGLPTDKKAREVGLDALYEFGFRIASHNVHGTWHDLEFYQLKVINGHFEPEIKYHRPRPQILAPPTVASLDTAKAYLEFAVGDDSAEIIGRLGLLRDWFRELSERHEKWLGSRPGSRSE